MCHVSILRLNIIQQLKETVFGQQTRRLNLRGVRLIIDKVQFDTLYYDPVQSV